MEYHELTLPLPGGHRSITLALEDGAGYLTNPYREERCPLYDVACEDGGIRCKAMVGRTEFVLERKKSGKDWSLTTHETIPLESGCRLAGVPGQLPGEYLVGVYSPGGVKENHFVITEESGVLGGEMYCLMDEKTLRFMEEMMAKMPPMPEGQMPPMPKVGDKCDINPFLSVTGGPEGFAVKTRTGSGSLFVFVGQLRNERLEMTLHVTDENDHIAEK